MEAEGLKVGSAGVAARCGCFYVVCREVADFVRGAPWSFPCVAHVLDSEETRGPAGQDSAQGIVERPTRRALPRDDLLSAVPRQLKSRCNPPKAKRRYNVQHISIGREIINSKCVPHEYL